MNSNLIPKLIVFKQIEEVNLDLLPHFFKLMDHSQANLSSHTSSKWCCGKKTQAYHLVRPQSSQTSLKFWDFAFQTAIYLINRIPTTSLKFQVPYIVLFNKSPNYNFLRNFGCSCYPFLIPYNKHKLDFRLHECLFLSYSIS